MILRDFDNNDLNEDLKKWFKEKWVRFGPDGKIRGDCARGDSSEGKPKCLPQSKAHALGKKGRKYAASKKRREDPNPERTGKAINVKTKKKSAVHENNEQYEIRPLDNDTIRKIKIRLLDYWQSKDLKNIRIRHSDNDIFHVIGSYPMGETVDIEYQFDRLDRKIKYLDQTVISEQQICPECGGPAYSNSILAEKQDACYHKVRSRYKVWPSAYASGALVQCRKKGAKNWGNKSR
jgi:hypothetical protein